MNCGRRSAVDDDRSRNTRLAVDDDRRQERWTVDDARSRIAFYQAQWKKSLDQVDENLDRIRETLQEIRKMRMSSGTIPMHSSSSSISSSASRRRHQSRHTPTLVDDYAPLELPLRWRDPLLKYPPLERPVRWRDPLPPQATSPNSNPIVPLPLQQANNEPALGDERDSAPGDERDSATGDKRDSSSLPITDKATGAAIVQMHDFDNAATTPPLPAAQTELFTEEHGLKNRVGLATEKQEKSPEENLPEGISSSKVSLKCPQSPEAERSTLALNAGGVDGSVAYNDTNFEQDNFYTGGDIPIVKISALNGENVDELLETVMLVAEMQGLKANPHRKAKDTCTAGVNMPFLNSLNKIVSVECTQTIRRNVIEGSCSNFVLPDEETIAGMLDGSVIKLILCTKCDPYSSDLFTVETKAHKVPVLCSNAKSNEASMDFCKKVGNACKNEKIQNSLFSAAASNSEPISSSKVTDHWKFSTEFCKALGGSVDTESICFNGTSVSFENTVDLNPPQGICVEKIGNGSYLSMDIIQMDQTGFSCRIKQV